MEQIITDLLIGAISSVVITILLSKAVGELMAWLDFPLQRGKK